MIVLERAGQESSRLSIGAPVRNAELADEADYDKLSEHDLADTLSAIYPVTAAQLQLPIRHNIAILHPLQP